MAPNPGMTFGFLRFIFAVAFLSLLPFPSLAAPEQFLHGHVPKVISHLQPIGRPAPTKRLNLAIGFPLRNQAALGSLLRQIEDPASPNFRHYLTPEQFAEQFGPSESDYETAAKFFAANGFTVTARYPNRVILDVNGSVADIERVFHTTLRTYRHPTENRDFFAPDAEPSIDLSVPIMHVSGLNNYSLPHPQSKIEPLSQTTHYTGSGPFGSYLGNDFRAAYLPGVTTNQLSGTGQIIGLVEFDGYYSSDIASYENMAGLPNVVLTNELIDGFSGPSGNTSQILEVSLDIEMAISMAPGISKIIVYEEPNGDPWADMLSQIVNDSQNLAGQIGCSWGAMSPGAPDPNDEALFYEMRLQGQTFFNATGDSDAFTSGVPFPSESTNITQVGGTTLTTGGPAGSRVSETTWNRGNGVGSSGGVSVNYLIPSWQQGISMTANQGSTTHRNVPDVAMTADNVFVIANNGLTYTNVGGTSVAAPLWAGFTALANQWATNNGLSRVGYINDAIYAIGKSANYTADFHDITTGSNCWSGSSTKYYATNGYDLCTGWGTPNGMNLITALATPDSLGILPGAGFNATGPEGGPFSIASQTFSLTNSGGSALNWALQNVPAWLSVSQTGGTLTSHGSTTMTANLNFVSSNLLAGTYSTNLVFTNLTSHFAQFRPFALLPGQSLVLNGGFEGSFPPWTLVGTGPYINFVDDGSVTGYPPHSGTYFAALGEYQNGAIAYLSQTLQTVPGQSYLISFWLENTANGSNLFFVNWLTNSANTNRVYTWNNSPVFGYSNALFVVTATGTNTTLQFGADNYSWYWCLDDVSVAPIPNPLIRAITETNNGGISFTWNSLAQIQYQIQTNDDLAEGTWGVFSIVTATNSTTTLTNSIGPDPVRFYRLRRLP